MHIFFREWTIVWMFWPGENTSVLWILSVGIGRYHGIEMSRRSLLSSPIPTMERKSVGFRTDVSYHHFPEAYEMGSTWPAPEKSTIISLWRHCHCPGLANPPAMVGGGISVFETSLTEVETGQMRTPQKRCGILKSCSKLIRDCHQPWKDSGYKGLANSKKHQRPPSLPRHREVLQIVLTKLCYESTNTTSADGQRVEWKGSEVEQKVFEKMKVGSNTASVDTDASDVGVGSVLSKIQEGVEWVIAYYSKILAPPEQNYCVTRKELLAVVKAVNTSNLIFMANNSDYEPTKSGR